MKRSRDYKADIEKISEGYQEARDYEFNNQFLDFRLGMDEDELFTEDLLQGFLESFTFPEEFEWSASEYESQRDAYEDAKFEEMRDERLGLNE